MRREDVPSGHHIAIPTKDSDILHEGQYAHSCEICRVTAARLAFENAPSWSGQLIGVGSVVKIDPAYLFGASEWVTITEVRLNTYTGEIWMAAFALGDNLVLQAGNIIEVREP